MIFSRSVTLLVFSLWTCVAAGQSYLIKPGDQWRYYDVKAEPGNNWQQNPEISIDWPKGKAPLGYGENNEATITSFGEQAKNKIITQYFVKMFTVENKALIDSLQMHLQVDDGAIIYLNGKVLKRFNLPQQVDHQTLANTSFIETAWVSESIDSSQLIDGVNMLAAQVHQIKPSSSDLRFNLSLSYNPSRAPILRDIKPLLVKQAQLVTQPTAKRFSRQFVINLAHSTKRLTIDAIGGSGDADLYAERNQPVKLSQWSWRSKGAGDESITIEQPSKGKYYIALYSYRPFADVRLMAKWH